MIRSKWNGFRTFHTIVLMPNDECGENKMIEILITLAVLTVLFWIGFHVTGALLSAAIWLFIKLPFAVILGCLGLVLRHNTVNSAGRKVFQVCI